MSKKHHLSRNTQIDSRTIEINQLEGKTGTLRKEQERLGYKARAPKRSIDQKVNHISLTLLELRMSLGEFLYHTSKLEGEDGIKLGKNGEVAATVSQFLRGHTK